MDAAARMLRHPEMRARGRELALAYGVADKLDTWLKDPRLRAEIEETRAGERLRRLAQPTAQPPRQAGGRRQR